MDEMNVNRETDTNADKNEAMKENTAPLTSNSANVPKAMSGVGVCSVLCGLFSFFFPLPALAGIGLAIYGIRRDRKDLLCYFGLCLSCALLAFNMVGMVQMCRSGRMDALLGAQV